MCLSINPRDIISIPTTQIRRSRNPPFNPPFGGKNLGSTQAMAKDPLHDLLSPARPNAGSQTALQAPQISLSSIYAKTRTPGAGLDVLSVSSGCLPGLWFLSHLMPSSVSLTLLPPVPLSHRSGPDLLFPLFLNSIHLSLPPLSLSFHL